MSAAEHQRNYRARRRRGERVGRILYGLAEIEMLLANNYLLWSDSENPAAIDAALTQAIRDLSKRYV